MSTINTARRAAGLEPEPEPERRFTQADVDKIVQDRLARDREARSREARVTHEPRTYGLESPHSYYADVWLMQQPEARGHQGARERRAAYVRELGYEMERGSAEGRHAEKQIRARLRTSNASEHERQTAAAIRECRALVTGGGITASASGGGGAAFVSPFFVIGQWAPFRGVERTFADQCHKLPLPPYGMRVYLPTFSATTEAGAQTEGSAVAEKVPTTALEGAEVETQAGRLTITQQLFDRAYTGGGSMDAVIHQQINEQLDQEVDLYALNQALASASQVVGASSYTTKALYKDIALAKEKLSDTAGTRLRSTHLFSTSDMYDFATRQLDGSERPIVVPTSMPGFPITTGVDSFDGEPSPKWARFTGTVMPGNLLWFTDDNIPVVGTVERTQLIVSSPAVAMVLMEDEPVLMASVETLANELRVVLTLREYVAAITRHAAGTAAISGGAYVTSEI